MLSGVTAVEIVAGGPSCLARKIALASFGHDEGRLTIQGVAVGASAALDVIVERDGHQVDIIPFVSTCSDPGVARADEHCRPPKARATTSITS